MKTESRVTLFNAGSRLTRAALWLEVATHMKLHTTIVMAALALAATATPLLAQDEPGNGPRPRQGGPDGGPRPPMPIIAVLDANHDGTIDASEIDNAPAALRSLDKNGDGSLTRQELRPPRPEGAGRPDGERPRREGRPGGPRPGNRPPQTDARNR